MADAQLSGDIVKIDPERRIAYGYAYIAKQADGTQVIDHSGDVIDTDDAIDAVHRAFDNYARDHRTGDVDHETFGVSKLVEYVWMDAEKAAAMGVDGAPTGAWVGYHFPEDDGGPGDQAWDAVKKREKVSFSLVGSGRREEL